MIDGVWVEPKEHRQIVIMADKVEILKDAWYGSRIVYAIQTSKGTHFIPKNIYDKHGYNIEHNLKDE